MMASVACPRICAAAAAAATEEGRYVLCRPEEFGGKRFLLKSIAYNATARSDMFTLPCSTKVCAPHPLYEDHNLGSHRQHARPVFLMHSCSVAWHCIILNPHAQL